LPGVEPAAAKAGGTRRSRPRTGGARPEGSGLFADQTLEIEGALVARWRGPHGADRGEQQHEYRSRNAEEHPDCVAYPVKVPERDAFRVGREHLPIRQVVAVREILDEGDLVMTQRDYGRADFAVAASPQKVNANATAEEDDDQVEACVIISPEGQAARGWTWIAS
jgi:hypothetical protein